MTINTESSETDVIDAISTWRSAENFNALAEASVAILDNANVAVAAVSKYSVAIKYFSYNIRQNPAVFNAAFERTVNRIYDEKCFVTFAYFADSIRFNEKFTQS